MRDQPRRATYSQPDGSEEVIEATIPAKKPASDLPSDDFFDQTSYRPIYPTGGPNDTLTGRVEGIHVIGGLHHESRTIERLIDNIVRYRPDIVAVEACQRAVFQRHPDHREPQWPPDHEVEAASFAARYTDGLSIAGIDLPPEKRAKESGNDKFVEADTEIFTEFGLIDSPTELTLETYYDLNRSLIRDWRSKTRERIPELFRKVLETREDAMAGHLYELYHKSTVETVVAVVGVQHLTGVLDRLQAPHRIPNKRFRCPKTYTYEPGEFESVF